MSSSHHKQDRVGNQLVSELEIDRRISEMAIKISKDYSGLSILIVAVLKGAFVFTADLLRRLDRNAVTTSVDFFRARSYGMSDTTSGEVEIVMDVTEQVEGRHVILVDDVLDSGRTLLFLKEKLTERNPASLKCCVLLDKPSRREVDIGAEYVGFEIPNHFVIGYGLDYAEQFRYLPYVAVLDKADSE